MNLVLPMQARAQEDYEEEYAEDEEEYQEDEEYEDEGEGEDEDEDEEYQNEEREKKKSKKKKKKKSKSKRKKKKKRSKKSKNSRDDDDDDDDDDGPHPLLEGIMVDRFNRRGMHASILIGFSRCMATRRSRCSGATLAGSRGRTKSSIGGAKELGFRLPWLFLGGSYSLAFMRPSWQDPRDPNLRFYRVAYQHTFSAVARPTIPFWRFDFGVTIAPGWSRQVFRRKISRDREFTQGFNFGTGFLFNVYVTQQWVLGLRYDYLLNAHGVVCKIEDEQRKCKEATSDSIAGANIGLSGLYFSHRW